MPLSRREPYNPLLKSYPDSEKINSCSEGAETLFTRLLAQADDLNHYFGDPAMVLGKLYTRRMCAGQVNRDDVRKRIDELANARLIEIYDVEGRQYIDILNRRNTLRPDKQLDVRFPERPANSNGRNYVTDTDRISNDSDTDSLSSPTLPDPTRTIPTQPLSAAHFPPVVTGEKDLPQGFVRFWKGWPRHPRKQGRAKCLAFWKRHKLEPIADRVVEVLGRCKVSKEWASGEFVPMPITWLGRTPWETDSEEMNYEKPRTPERVIAGYIPPRT